MSETYPYILVAESDEDNRYFLHTAFTKSGLSVPLKFVDSGEIALRYLQQLAPSFFPSLIILDINMPGLNGHEVLSLIQKDEQTKKIPVFFYSASMKNVVKELLIAIDAIGCFEKNEEIDQLIAKAFDYVVMSDMQAK